MNKKAQINTINLLFGLSVILFVVFGGIVWGLGIIYASDNYRIQKITSDGTTTLLAGSPTVGSTTDIAPSADILLDTIIGSDTL
jgi:hypothetical protein